MKFHFDTNSISANRSLTYWREAVCSNLIGVECLSNPHTGINGRFTLLARDDFAIARLQANAHRAVREHPTLRKSETGFYMLFLQKSGSMRVQRQSQDFIVKPGDMYFYDGLTEHHLTFEEQFDHLAIRVPRAIVEKQWGSLAEIGSFHLKATQNIVDQVLIPMTSAALGARDSHALPAVVHSIFELFSTRAFDEEILPLGRTAHARLTLARVSRKISICLDDPDFNVEKAAQHLRMSRRNLDRLIAGCGTSFTKILMEKRLCRAADLLRQQTSSRMSVTQIALAAGFENHSFFSRKFRERFGASPRSFRIELTMKDNQKSDLIAL